MKVHYFSDHLSHIFAEAEGERYGLTRVSTELLCGPGFPSCRKVSGVIPATDLIPVGMADGAEIAPEHAIDRPGETPSRFKITSSGYHESDFPDNNLLFGSHNEWRSEILETEAWLDNIRSRKSA